MCFNPRTRTGCDDIDEGGAAIIEVSTHAPARGATGALLCGAEASGGFQPTHPHGVRRVHSAMRCPCSFGFQPTHPHGVRHKNSGSSINKNGFNPRTRTGCDVFLLDSGAYPVVSTHAPARGATSSRIVMVSSKVMFQPTHPHGVRRLGACNTRERKYMFQPTHPHGVRPRRSWERILWFAFQPTHPHGVRRPS